MVRLRNVPLPEPFVLGVGVGAVLHRLRPWRLPGSRPIQRMAGTILLGCGTMLNLRAVQAAGSVVVEDPDRLLTTGPYALTRNPMYLGWALLHLGCALLAGSGWLLAAELPAALVVHRAVLSEERRLEARFGAEFERYRAMVGRYLPLGGPEYP
ncbi:MAG TPA: isoprenylcysteine carboxylmethyltransferase family protein [Propionibacteriaceae bacterium]|nr:isoprenylcysteine carboxylmethyltransferase family protein [Propionibacteriaceae bacterium]